MRAWRRRYVRRALIVRDAGVCALCGIDARSHYLKASNAVTAAAKAGPASASVAAAHAAATEALRAATVGGPFEGCARLSGAAPGKAASASKRRRPRFGARVAQGSFWQADHIVAVADGGGSCGLANIRTLCTGCHGGVTARQAAERAKERRRRAGAASASCDGADESGSSRSSSGSASEESDHENSAQESQSGPASPSAAAASIRRDILYYDLHASASSSDTD